MATTRAAQIAIHLRRMAAFEMVARNNVRRVLIRHGRVAAKAYETDGTHGVEIALGRGQADHQKLLTRFYPLVARAFAEPVFKALQEPQMDFDLALLDFIRRFGMEKAKQIHGTTMAKVRTLIATAEQEGLAVSVIAKQIREQSSLLSKFRSRAIARTETHNAATYASQTAAESTGLRLVKEWLAAKDERTRGADTGGGHWEADGQRRDMKDLYDVPGFGTVPAARMMRPGDPSAHAGQTIQCRCGELYHRV